MNESYSINELAMITSLTTRTLRNHLRQGALTGEKVDGAWTFTTEDITAFMAQPTIRQSIASRRNAVVFDFLADTYKRANRACLILDLPVADDEGEAVSNFFCDSVNRIGADMELRVAREGRMTRVILAGSEDAVMEIAGRYYQG